MSQIAKIVQESQLPDCISSIWCCSRTSQIFAGCIDEIVYGYSLNGTQLTQNKQIRGNDLGIIDITGNVFNNCLAVSALDSTIRIYDTETGSKVTEIVAASPMESWKMTFCNEGKSILTAGEEGTVYEFEALTGQTIKTLPTGDAFVSALALSPDQKFLACGNSEGNIFVFDLSQQLNGQQLQAPVRMPVHHSIIRSLSFTADSLKLLSASDDSEVGLTDLYRMVKSNAFTGCQGNINCVDTHPLDSNKFITASYDNLIRIWDVNQKNSASVIQHHISNIWAAKYVLDGSMIVSGAENGQLALHIIY